MTYSISDAFALLGGLGLFIYGMKVMSDALQKSAGSSLRMILRKMTSNTFMGVMTGFIVTALLQSSSATTVMVVSFVNAGLLNLAESMGVIMGANVGTTITAWIVSILGFKVKISAFALPIIGVSFGLMFIPSKKWKNVGEIAIGFGLLFIGLSFLKDSVPDIQQNPQILSFIEAYTHSGIWSVILFVFIGFVLTVVVQSSSASLAITLVMVAQGWIDFKMAAAMFLGGNVGTTITALLAALIGNIHAKRAALFHCVFNVLGVVWVMLILDEFLMVIDQIIVWLFGHSTLGQTQSAEDTTIALSIFHTVFNVLNTLVFIWFIPQLEKWVVKIMPSTDEDDEQTYLKYLTSGVMGTPELSIANARMEVQLMAKMIDKICVSYMALLFEKPKNVNKLLAKIKKREEITDKIELEISKYLTKCAEGELSASASKRIREMLRVVNDLERIADVVYQLSLSHERLIENKFTLKEDVVHELKDLFGDVYKGIKSMRTNLDISPDEVNMDAVYELENRINSKRDSYQQTHYERIEDNVYHLQEGLVFLDLIHGMEKIGDHIVNVNEAVAGLKFK